MNGARVAKITPAMPTWAGDGHPEAHATDRDMGNPAEILTFNGDDRANVGVIGQDLRNAAQVAETLLADVAGHQDISCRGIAKRRRAFPGSSMTAATPSELSPSPGP